jgi:hypothetical protein
MRKLGFIVAASVLALGVSAPVLAHPIDGYESQHDYDHDQLDQEHQDEHDYLDEIHREAHEEGLTPWEHRRLHQYLDREHAREHRELDREHRWEHENNRWNPWYYGSGWPQYRYYRTYRYYGY